MPFNRGRVHRFFSPVASLEEVMLHSPDDGFSVPTIHRQNSRPKPPLPVLSFSLLDTSARSPRPLAETADRQALALSADPSPPKLSAPRFSSLKTRVVCATSFLRPTGSCTSQHSSTLDDQGTTSRAQSLSTYAACERAPS